jgi:hypothetical protein
MVKPELLKKRLKWCLSTDIAIAGLLGCFNTYLPSKLFLSLLSSFVIIAIILSIWLITIYIPPQRIKNLCNNYKTRRQDKIRRLQKVQEETKVIEQWVSKWQELSSLINSSIFSDRVPTEEEDQQYKELHNWFIDNRNIIQPIWYDFWYKRTRISTEEHERDYPIFSSVLTECRGDPFSYFYGFYEDYPLAHLALKRKIVGDSSNEPWKKNEHNSYDMKKALSFLNDRATEFLAWYKSRQH